MTEEDYWLEEARKYHSISDKPGYHTHREPAGAIAPSPKFLKTGGNLGPKQELRSAHHGTARDSAEDDPSGGRPVRNFGVGCDKGLRSETGGWSPTAASYSREEQQ